MDFEEEQDRALPALLDFEAVQPGRCEIFAPTREN
jgi:hypothetical protein